jgi:hypothetical protein
MLRPFKGRGFTLQEVAHRAFLVCVLEQRSATAQV